MVLSLIGAGAMSAQRESAPKPPKPKPLPKVSQVLDTWVITRYRDAQLLPDSVTTARASVLEVPPPRVESVGDAISGDTIYAVRFDEKRDVPAMRVGTQSRLTAPSGSITGINAEIVARRPFRAPRVPGADTTAPGGWRFGWAYLAIVRPPNATPAASMYRGWLLLNAIDTSTRRP